MADIQIIEEIVEHKLEQRSWKKDRELFERAIRVEEELKNHQELIKMFMAQVDKRFEQVDKRFEQVDKRFEQMDKRFTFMQWMIYLGFTITIVAIGVVRFLA